MTKDIKTSFVENDKRKATFEEVVDTSWGEKWGYDIDYNYYIVDEILFTGTPSMFSNGLDKKVTKTYLLRCLK